MNGCVQQLLPLSHTIMRGRRTGALGLALTLQVDLLAVGQL